MIKITRVYTKTGDQGDTAIAGGQRMKKFDKRIQAIGTVDELNAVLGLVVVYLNESTFDFFDLVQSIQQRQNELFDMGASLARADKITTYLTQKHVDTLENEIDQMNEHLPTLNSFILPGGSKIAAQLHVARTVCRRAERILVKLHQKAPTGTHTIPYINRLSDWLFVTARFVNSKLNIDEPLWKLTNNIL